MTVKLYESPHSRSDRVRWAMLELDCAFESRSGHDLFGSDELKAVHPQGKLPALEDDGRPLFESAAICTWLADKHADKGLIAPSGTWERALHDQWTAFTLAELEAHLWSTARNIFIYPEEEREKVVIDQAVKEIRRGLEVFEKHLAEHDYMVADRFSVTDIIVGFATNWAVSAKQTGDFPHVEAYNARLMARPLCHLSED
ncbi:MAG: glutathione S-transferase family protein [Alphaproteobacteria bacterium]|nr:glutathione S-transferase family protein [Rhodospirillaceae bacterium]MBT6206362.1 glutathione S-transferase family protein [Rhodospirillaceae bacterium]MBT6511160.1 glutathione S-transferase family protein [Rhodospirillaceae bacterium]MDG2481410.1 glutathione S-transferase family protein [Alphaproteobacteria bacterium]